MLNDLEKSMSTSFIGPERNNTIIAASVQQENSELKRNIDDRNRKIRDLEEMLHNQTIKYEFE